MTAQGASQRLRRGRQPQPPGSSPPCHVSLTSAPPRSQPGPHHLREESLCLKLLFRPHPLPIRTTGSILSASLRPLRGEGQEAPTASPFSVHLVLAEVSHPDPSDQGLLSSLGRGPALVLFYLSQFFFLPPPIPWLTSLPQHPTPCYNVLRMCPDGCVLDRVECCYEYVGVFTGQRSCTTW